MSITALMPLAHGVEEMEAVILADTLRRAEWDVTLAGLEAGPVVASRGVRLLPDTTWDAVDPLTVDVLVLPGGGPGTQRLGNQPGMLDVLRARVERKAWVAAICAAPMVLHAAGILAGRKATCYPGCESGLDGVAWSDEPVVIDEPVITSRGPGTAFLLGIALIQRLSGKAASDAVAKAMLVRT